MPIAGVRASFRNGQTGSLTTTEGNNPMSTRSTLTVREKKDGTDTYSIYRHHDGYPDAVLPDLREALSYAWPLPRYEPMDFAAAIVAAWKRGPKRYSENYTAQGGSIYLTRDRDAHGDTEWHYEIYPETPDESPLCIEVFASTYPDGYDKPAVWVREGNVHYLTADMQAEVPADA